GPNRGRIIRKAIGALGPAEKGITLKIVEGALKELVRTRLGAFFNWPLRIFSESSKWSMKRYDLFRLCFQMFWESRKPGPEAVKEFAREHFAEIVYAYFRNVQEVDRYMVEQMA